MILKWYKVDDKDIAATENEFVFRLKKDIDKIKRPYKDDIQVPIMKLQVRKKQNIDFRDLGYKFLLERTNDYDHRYVDEKKWTSITDIAERTEEILLSLDFIEQNSNKENTPQSSPPEVLRSAAKGMIRAFQSKGYMGIIKEHKVSFLEDMILRVLSFWEHKEPVEIDFEDPIDNKISLKEFELNIKMLMSEPTMYFQGGWPQTFKTQSYLHDEEWLNSELEEEKEERCKPPFKQRI